MRLSFEQVDAILRYDPETGNLYWKKNRGNACKAGDVAGHRMKSRRVHVTIKGKRYYGHVLAWLLTTKEWPPSIIDHADIDGTNNRWPNLRLCNRAQNKQNSLRRKNNGLPKGVSKDTIQRLEKPFYARIRINGRSTYLGHFTTAEEAGAAYASAAISHFGEFARIA